MTDFMLSAASFVMIVVAVGLLRLMLGPTNADRMMAGQLLGTGGVAALMLLAVARRSFAVIDVALALAVLAAFASLALVLGGLATGAEDRQ
jgi:multicomponent Na+:H+ antiporter subunit F